MSSATVAALEVVLQREHDPAMEELRRELAAARALLVTERGDYRNLAELCELHLASNSDLRQHLAQARADSLSDWWAMGSDVEPRRLLTWREYLEQEVAYHQEREAHLADGADRLVRWAAQGGSEEDVPDEIWRAIQVMRGDEVDESDDDAEMAVDSTAVP
jgi:hypothetical protein